MAKGSDYSRAVNGMLAFLASQANDEYLARDEADMIVGCIYSHPNYDCISRRFGEEAASQFVHVLNATRGRCEGL